MRNNYYSTIEILKEKIGSNKAIVFKNFLIGNINALNSTLIYIDGLVNNDIINRDILNPLMLKINEELYINNDLPDYLCKKYITNDTSIINNIDNAAENLKNGSAVIVIEGLNIFISINVTGGEYRGISDPASEFAIKGPRESFVENIDTNINILTRRIKEKNLVIENMKIGARSETKVSIMYIRDLVNEEVLKQLKFKLEIIDVDFLSDNGMLEQYIEDYPYSIFPQMYTTERPDVIESNLMSGKIAIILDGTPSVISVPALFTEFFQGVEDYYQRTLISNFTRMLRYIACIIIITLPSIYLTLIKYNVELIPLKFIIPIAQSRINIALPPFFEILFVEIIVELLREGGMRLPSKIGQTLSIVGGIIIGDTAIEAKIVSPSTLLIVGITVVSTFLIPNYDMALSIRLIRFPMLVLAYFMGIFGIAVGWYLIVAHLYDLESFSVPYFSLNKGDIKDVLIRVPLWKMKYRPKDIVYKDKTSQSYFKNKLRGKNNE